MLGIEFIFEEIMPPSHCKDFVLAGPQKDVCGPDCIEGKSTHSHHSCADRKVGSSLYCVCPKNKDKTENGNLIKYYFRATKMDYGTFCPSCSANCR